METKEFVCHGGIGDADHGNEQPCLAGPCTAVVKSCYDPCYCLLFGDDGEHIPNWEESCDGQVVVEDTTATDQVSSATPEPGYTTVTEPIEEEVEPAGTSISEAVIDAAQWLIDQEHTFMFSADESKFEDERTEHIDRIRDNLTYTQLAALVLSLSLYSAEFKDCLKHIQEMER